MKNNKKVVKVVNENDNEKIYRVLSYIGLLWLVGLFVKEKDNKDVRFHVGQGMILTIANLCASFVVNLINNLFVSNIFKKEVIYFGIPTGVYTTNGIGIAIQTIFNLALAGFVIYFMATGIINALRNDSKYLPIIGKYAFYK